MAKYLVGHFVKPCEKLIHIVISFYMICLDMLSLSMCLSNYVYDFMSSNLSIEIKPNITNQFSYVKNWTIFIFSFIFFLKHKFINTKFEIHEKDEKSFSNIQTINLMYKIPPMHLQKEAEALRQDLLYKIFYIHTNF